VTDAAVGDARTDDQVPSLAAGRPSLRIGGGEDGHAVRTDGGGEV
jgi:hypothetical protein